jgi:hypothetical protein
MAFDTSSLTPKQMTAYNNGLAEAMMRAPQLIPHRFNEAALAEAWTLGYDDGVQELKSREAWERAQRLSLLDNGVWFAVPFHHLHGWCPRGWCPRDEHLVVVRDLAFIHGGRGGAGGLLAVLVFAITAAVIIWAIGGRK